MKEPRNDFIVGIGASAGGIKALQEFFGHVPVNSDICYIVILHLSPDHDSKLAEVLRHAAAIPVTQVTEKTLVQVNHVYVIPPNRHLTMSDSHILVSPNMEEEDRRAPVDIFFRTLASSYGARAACVILSGTGANGSMGLKRVKEMGGAAFVQSPGEAEFNEMPRNAIATDLVDDILPIADIPEKIIAYKNSLGTVHIPVEAEKRAEDQQHALREIFSHLRVRTGHDFSNYKRPTLLRRIERRINIRNLPDLPAYAEYLQLYPEEVNALLKDLLISVTNFFRDKKAFETIERDVLPSLLHKKKSNEVARIWIAGCATGEEAYSFAMFCAEQTTNIIDGPRIQIFATDIDEAAISVARDGLYTINDAADVSPERLRRFFNKEEDGYRIRREIREMILFASHNFIKDPPFSRVDILSCRNVLIYLNHTAQERVMETFHFALNPGGYLFLGLSESADSASDLYTTFNREFHIFQTRQINTRTYQVPEQVPIPGHNRPAASPESSLQQYSMKERITLGDLHQRLLEEYAPPSVVINEEYDIVHLSERSGRYLQVTGGEPSQNLLKMIRQELRLELRSALYQARQRRTAVETRGLRVNLDNQEEIVNIHVRPVFREGDVGKGFILVIFEPAAKEPGVQQRMVVTSGEPVARHLEEELIRVKTQLRSSVEQHEFQAEELKASNEELQAMNEELRSSAEELETSKEELQSINEELRTVNQELKIKVEETTLAGNNLQNLINSVDIATIFLDKSFRVALFTPPARDLFNLIPNDLGRALSDITNKLQYADIIKDVETVVEKLHLVEREVKTLDGRLFLMRVLPYRTQEDRINGVVITFFDITEQKASEEALRKSEERFRIALKASDMAAWDWDVLNDNVVWNEQHFTILGLTPNDKQRKAKYFMQFIHPDDVPQVRNALTTAIKEGIAYQVEFRIIRDDNGEVHWMNGYGRVVAQQQGRASRIVGVMYDITHRKELEKQKDDFIGIASHELKTPVTSIKAYAQVLHEIFKESGDKRSADFMNRLNIQVTRLTDLIKALLDTTKISEGQLPLHLEEFDINRLITEQVADLGHLSHKHQIIFTPGQTGMIKADRERIGQVLTNLISNAVKYSPDGGSVIIESVPTPGCVEVSVKDSGIGIAQDLKDKIFERFFRVKDARTEGFPGMGLGLYISAGIIQRHGGNMKVESTPGQGSEFIFTLPFSARV